MRKAGYIGALLLVSLALGCAPKRVEVDYSPYAWPNPPLEPRVKLVKYIATDLDVRKPSTSEIMFGEDVTFAFGKPHGIAVDREENIYVSDTLRRDVAVLNLKNGTIGRLFNPDGWVTPMHVAVDDKNGLVAVADADKGSVYVFDMRTKSLKFKVGAGVLAKPIGVAFNPDLGRIYVSDAKNHAIYAFSISGEYITEVVSTGWAPGYIYFPAGLSTDSEGRIYVVDTMNFRFQIFTPDGDLVRAIGEHGDRPGMFARPKGISVSDDGYVFITDAAFGNFQIFDATGTSYLFVGQTGKGLGMFRIPQGIFIDHNDKVYVIDSLNSRVQIFQYFSERYKKEHPEESATASPTEGDKPAGEQKPK